MWLELRANKLKLNPNKTVVMLAEKAEVLRDIVLFTFDGTQLMLADSVKSLELYGIQHCYWKSKLIQLPKRHSISFI